MRVLDLRVLALVAVATAACADGGNAAPPAPSTAALPTTTTTAAPAGAASEPPTFASSVGSIDDATAERMSASWRPGCPVGLRDLRLVTVKHWGFDGAVRDGELVVHVSYADGIVSVFEQLFRARFPIQQIRLVDEFGADDDRSMAANNTSAFNCRPATGSNRWSEHAFGRAVDVNPVQNPFVTRSGAVLPPNGAAHARRDPATPGLIAPGSAPVAAFRSIGWRWGGDWSPGKDYQHFSATGR